MDVDLKTLNIGEDSYEAPKDMVSGANRVKLTNEGNLQVRAYPLLWMPEKQTQFENTTAYLIQNNEVVSQLPVGLDGKGLFRDISPGHYNLVIKSEFGICAQGIEVVPATTTATVNTDAQPMTASQDEPGSEAGAVLAEEGGGSGQSPTTIREYYFIESAPGGGFGAPIAGGPGGGFGNIGGLIETALAAWILTELIDEIDNNDNGQTVVQQPVIIEPPPPTSPAN